MGLIDKIVDYIFPIKEEQIEVTGGVAYGRIRTKADIEREELEKLRMEYQADREKVEKLKYKKELLSQGILDKHSCKNCKFADEEDNDWFTGLSVYCNVMDEEIFRTYSTSSVQEIRDTNVEYRANNNCKYFRKIEEYCGYSIEELLNIKE